MPGFTRCALDLGLFCLTPGELMLPLLLLGLLFAVGAWSAGQDDKAHRSRLKRGTRLALLLTLVSLAMSAWFVFFEPTAIRSSSSDPASQAFWVFSASLLAAGLSLLCGMGAYALGGALFGRRNRRNDRLLIAIDGPAASGKGTLARRVAAHYGLRWLDTGLIYRAVARDVAAAGRALDDVAAAVEAARALDANSLQDERLRGPNAGDAASIVAKIPEVRAALLAYQRDFARKGDGAVLDGRDIGTVVCPDAHVKIFVTASDEARAQRRYLEHQSRGEAVGYEELLADIRARDARDRERAAAPMMAAADAVTLDTTSLDADKAFAAAVSIIERARLR